VVLCSSYSSLLIGIVCGQSGAPRLQVNPAQSKVAVSDRQKLLAAMYDQFRALYTSLLVLDPSLPARHALAQELEVYEKSTRATYRNVRCNIYSVLTPAKQT
jgi:hypothetical protein